MNVPLGGGSRRNVHRRGSGPSEVTRKRSTAVIYARLSDVRKGDVEGIERQLREGRAHAERLGLEVVEELKDNDLSAAKRKRRPDFERLMTGIAADAWDVVVLRSLDRWVRRPAELERIIDLVETSKVDVEAIHGVIDLRTPQGRLLARMMTAVAMHEIEQVTQRVEDWHYDRANRGLPYHSMPGYGYHREKGSTDVAVVPEEAERIREAARRILADEPLRSIARSWNDDFVPAPGAGRWTSGMIRRILLSARVAGLRSHRGEVVAPGTWPAILERETWDRVVRLLMNPARNSVPIKGGRAPKLLTGIASCGKPGCGAPLNSKTERGSRRYFCRRCHGTTVYAEPLERLVELMLFDVVDSPNLARTLRRAGRTVDTSAITDEIVRLEHDLAELAAELGDGRLTMPEWKAARQGIDRRLSALRAELEQDTATTTLAPWAGKPGALRAAWEDEDDDELDLAEKRRILKAVFETIIVDPATVGRNYFDPDRVRPVWR